jgi:hypothetical protein
MTIDEAIAIMEDPTKHTMTCSQGELTSWLRELKEAKRLLKMAVEDLERLGGAEICFSYCDERCPFYCIGRCEEKHWKHLDEVLTLIGDDTNE